MGELWNAIPTSVLTFEEPRLLTDAEVFLNAKPVEDTVARRPRWARIVFVALAPGVVALIAIAAFAWTRGPVDAPVDVPVQTLQPSAHRSAARSRMLVRVGIHSLRLVRVIFYIAAIWQAIGLLPSLGWLSNPDGITGGMLALLAVKAAALALFALAARALRHLIDRLRKFAGNVTETEPELVSVQGENRA